EPRERLRMPLDDLGGRALVAGLPPRNELEIPLIVVTPPSSPGPRRRRIAHSVQQVDVTGNGPLRSGTRGSSNPGVTECPSRATIYPPQNPDGMWNGSATGAPSVSSRKTPLPPSCARSSEARTPSSWTCTRPRTVFSSFITIPPWGARLGPSPAERFRVLP